MDLAKKEIFFNPIKPMLIEGDALRKYFPLGEDVHQIHQFSTNDIEDLFKDTLIAGVADIILDSWKNQVVYASSGEGFGNLHYWGGSPGLKQGEWFHLLAINNQQDLTQLIREILPHKVPESEQKMGGSRLVTAYTTNYNVAVFELSMFSYDTI